MKHYDMWIGGLVPKSHRERVLKELNPVPLVQGQHECEYDIDVNRVPEKWYKRLWAAAKKDGMVGDHICESLPIGFNSIIFPDGIRIQEVKRK